MSVRKKSEEVEVPAPGTKEENAILQASASEVEVDPKKNERVTVTDGTPWNELDPYFGQGGAYVIDADGKRVRAADIVKAK